MASTGALGTSQTAQARTGFQGITNGIAWGDFAPTYAFQVDRGDAISGKATIADTDYATDDQDNYLGYVTTSLTTSGGVYEINPDPGDRVQHDHEHGRGPGPRDELQHHPPSCSRLLMTRWFSRSARVRV